MGEDAAPWYVGWYDPEGQRSAASCAAPASAGRRTPSALAPQGRGRAAAAGIVPAGAGREGCGRTSATSTRNPRPGGAGVWATREHARVSLGHFKRLVKPVLVAAITTRHVDDFIAARRGAGAREGGHTVSPAASTKTCAHLKAALAWPSIGATCPSCRSSAWRRRPKKLPTYVTGEHFAAIYAACDKARHARTARPRRPTGGAGPDGDGLHDGLADRRHAGLAPRRPGPGSGNAVTLGGGQQGQAGRAGETPPRGGGAPRRLAGFTPTVLAWNHDRRTLYSEFPRIQEAAGIQLPARAAQAHPRSATCTASTTCAGPSPR